MAFLSVGAGVLSVALRLLSIDNSIVSVAPILSVSLAFLTVGAGVLSVVLRLLSVDHSIVSVAPISILLLGFSFCLCRGSFRRSETSFRR
ncbi:hypothetical protein [Lysinibacillus sp. RS5]|uniref:hypothetical protein n=1 Tax=unclassified Lysinibacillus TaxID=2636778 RepID=UPI0035BE49D0